jgi:hypothetical protein
MKIGQFHDLLSCLRFSMSSSGIYLSGAMKSEQPKGPKEKGTGSVRRQDAEDTRRL